MYYFITFLNYRNFQNTAGINVAIKNDKNNSDCETNTGNISIGKIIPTNRLFEKSGTGNNKNPPINPTIIDMYAVFSFIFLL
jgi:hypothetical protein